MGPERSGIHPSEIGDRLEERWWFITFQSWFGLWICSLYHNNASDWVSGKFNLHCKHDYGENAGNEVGKK